MSIKLDKSPIKYSRIPTLNGSLGNWCEKSSDKQSLLIIDKT